MTDSGGILKFRKIYKFYFVLLAILIVASCITYVVTGPLITLELVVGAGLIALLASIIYLGSMIIELDNKINKLESEIHKQSKDD